MTSVVDDILISKPLQTAFHKNRKFILLNQTAFIQILVSNLFWNYNSVDPILILHYLNLTEVGILSWTNIIISSLHYTTSSDFLY